MKNYNFIDYQSVQILYGFFELKFLYMSKNRKIIE